MKLIVFVFLVGVFVYWLLQTKSKTEPTLLDETSSNNDEPVSLHSSRLIAALQSIDLSFPPLMDSSEEFIKVQSMLSDSEYLLSLKEQTCTCEDFVLQRSNQPKNQLSRCCKHLLRALNQRGAFDHSNKWVKAMGDAGFGGPRLAWTLQLESATEVAMTIGLSKDWINVYAHSVRAGERIANASGPIKNYGWSVSDHRWSYGDSPPGARELKKLLFEIEAIN
jgi:SWIM zinc finger